MLFQAPGSDQNLESRRFLRIFLGLRILRPIAVIRKYTLIMLGYGAVCFDFHLAVVRELDSVGEQVEEDLTQPVWVANHVRLCRRAQEAADLKPLAEGLACDRVNCFFHNLV